jgi:hypothetical protein
MTRTIADISVCLDDFVGAAERHLGIDRDAPDLRRLLVIR